MGGAPVAKALGHLGHGVGCALAGSAASGGAMRWLTTMMATLWAAVAFGATPADVWAQAHADAKALPPAEAKYTRYLTCFNVTGADAPARRDVLRKVLDEHLWKFSRYPNPPRLRKIGPDLWAMRLDLYGIDRYVYARLAFADPFFHVPVSPVVVDPRSGAVTAKALLENKPPRYGEPAPWLGDAIKVTELQTMVDSIAPVLRADWFFVQTCIQEGRGKIGEGYGFYDFLGVKDRAEYFDRIGYDPKLAKRSYKRFANLVQRRGPGVFPGQVFREGATDGPAWFTKDVNDLAKEERDALRQLGGNFKHQLEEWYGFNAAGVWVTALTDDKGALQNRAPAAVLVDHTKIGSDKNIDANLSCVRCHNTEAADTGALQPVKSYHHQLAITLEVPEKDKEDGELYVRELNSFVRRDGERYAERLRECNGMTVKELGEATIKLWDDYVERGRDVRQCAAELGTTPERLGGALMAAFARKKLDPVFVPLLVNETVRYEHWEKVYPTAMALLGYQP